MRSTSKAIPLTFWARLLTLTLIKFTLSLTGISSNAKVMMASANKFLSSMTRISKRTRKTKSSNFS